MYLEAVDLLVMKCIGAYDGIGAKEFSTRTAQACVGGERPGCGEPRAYGALWNVAMETLAKECLRLGERVAEIERGDALKDEFQRIGLVLAWLPGEAVQAFGALEDLQGLQAISSLALSNGARTAAGWAGRVLFCSGD
jgi:hypothetical protein